MTHETLFFGMILELCIMTSKFLLEEYNNIQSIFSVTTIMVTLQKDVQIYLFPPHKR